MNLKQVLSIIFVLLSAARVLASSVELRKEAQEVNDSYALLTAESNANKELEVLRSIAAVGNEVEYDRWKVAVKNDWLKAFLVYEAIEAQKFGFALKVFNEISIEASEFDAIKLHMQEGSDKKYEWILLVLEKAVLKVPNLTQDIKEKVVDLRRAIVRKIHGLSLIDLGITANVAASIKEGNWVTPYAAIANSFIHSEVSRQYYYSDDALKQAIEADKPGLVNLLLLNHEKINAGNLTVALTNLSKLDLYKLVKSPLMIRQFKKFKIPILWDYLQLRDFLSNITPESKRSEMLNLLKLTTAEEKNRFKEEYDGDAKLTVREAIMTGDWKKVSGIFLRDDVGVYQKEWIPLSIKFCGLNCFDTLLRERVPLPEKEVLEKAYRNAKDNTVKDYEDKMEAYSKYYKDGKCIDGPLGCDKEKYDEWIELNNPTDDTLRNAVEKDKHEIIGTVIKNYMNKKGKNPANETDVADSLGACALQLYLRAKSPEMIKKLKEFKVPMIKGDFVCIRGSFSGVKPESRQSQILNMLKLTTNEEKKRYMEFYKGNDKMTVEHAIRKKSNEHVSGIFLRDDVGVYKSEWFKLAITVCGFHCFSTLLSQRVPLPEKSVLEEAFANAPDLQTFNVERYRNRLDDFKELYKDGVCIDGPLGCDKDKYEAWLRSEGITVTNSTGSASGSASGSAGVSASDSASGSTSGSVGGLSGLFTSAAATHASECTPLA